MNPIGLNRKAYHTQLNKHIIRADEREGSYTRTKVCTNCHVRKPLARFYKDMATCKHCNNYGLNDHDPIKPIGLKFRDAIRRDKKLPSSRINSLLLIFG